MIKRYGELIKTPVLDFQDGSLVGIVREGIIHPDTGKLEALWVKPVEHPFSYAVIQTQDVLEWKKNIYVKGPEVLADPADIIKITEIFSQNRPIVGNAVMTDQGHYWGKVVDADFDTMSGYLKHLYVEKNFLGLWPYGKRLLSYDLILEVLPAYILVSEKPEKPFKEPLLEDKQVLLDN